MERTVRRRRSGEMTALTLRLRSPLGLALERYRRAKGLGINELARLAKVDPAQLSRLERAHHVRAHAATLRKLAKALEVDLEDLMRLNALSRKRGWTTENAHEMLLRGIAAQPGVEAHILEEAWTRLLGVPLTPLAPMVEKLREEILMLPEPQLCVLVVHFASDVPTDRERADLIGLNLLGYRWLLTSALRILRDRYAALTRTGTSATLRADLARHLRQSVGHAIRPATSPTQRAPER